MVELANKKVTRKNQRPRLRRQLRHAGT